MLGAALFFLGNLSLAAASSVLARWLVPPGRDSLRLLAGFTSFVSLVSLLLLAGGIFGWLLPWPLVIGAVTIGALVCLVVRRSRAAGEESRGEADDPLWRPLAAALLAATAATILGKVCMAGTAYFSDDFGYHALAVVNWMRAHGFTEMPPSFVASYPFGSELIPLWFSLPFGHDGWAGLAGVLWGGGAAIALWTAARAMKASPVSAALLAAAGLASPQIGSFLVRTFSATDLAGAVCLMAAAILTAYANEENRAATLLAGAASGLALGCKVSYAPAVMLLGLSLLTRRRGWRGEIGGLALFAGAALAAGGWWYGRNWFLTGNPVFPAQLGPFAGPMTSAIQRSTELLPGVMAEPHPPRFWLGLLENLLDWPIGLALVSLAGYGKALAQEWRRDYTEPALARSVRRRLLLVGGVLLLLFPITPFSLGSGFVEGKLLLFPRYLAPSFLIGLALLAPALDGPRAGFWRAAVVLAWGTAWLGPGYSVATACAAGGYAAWLAIAPPARWKLIPWTALGLVFISVPLLASRQKAVTDRALAATGRAEGRPIGAAWAALNRLPDGSRLAALTNFPYQRSPLYGSRRQLNPVFLGDDGTVVTPLHERFAAGQPTEIRFLPFQALDGRTWRDRLVKAGVDYLLISRWEGTQWPAPYEPLRAAGGFETLFDDGYSVLWKLTP